MKNMLRDATAFMSVNLALVVIIGLLIRGSSVGVVGV
jgi:hypothetical protein